MLEIILLLKHYFTENKKPNYLLKTKHILFTFFFLSIIFIGYAQTATIKGVILDENNLPISDVNVKTLTNGTTSNSNGFYEIEIPSTEDVSIEFSHISYKKITIPFNLKNGETFEFNPVMKTSIEQIATVVVSSPKKDLSLNHATYI